MLPALMQTPPAPPPPVSTTAPGQDVAIYSPPPLTMTVGAVQDVSTVLVSPPETPPADKHVAMNSQTDGVETPKLTSSMIVKLQLPTAKHFDVTSKRPLRLLDLPIDILREITSHIPHANDLTSLALTHSVLHSLAIPCIYSRFDIVWPDQGMQTESRAGVDALTYGLATLVKAQELFGEAAFQRQRSRNKLVSDQINNPYALRRRRLGNYYAQYTKKFSLGNGPADCVREYLITKEGGKMLGTLVALAAARMPNLENFVWDMPTGVLRDVWLALSSLADRDDDEECRLEKVWIRWHNNWQTEISDLPPLPPPPPPPPNVPPPNLAHHGSNIQVPAPPAVITAEAAALPLEQRIEFPSFSVLPPLKSLTVLEIDELAYLDEMSILIARSQHRLKELRVGIARHARSFVWNANWDGPNFQQVDYNTTWTIASKVGDKRLQGVLGVLVGRIHNLRNNAETTRMRFGMDYLAKVLNREQKSEDDHVLSHAESDVTESIHSRSNSQVSQTDVANVISLDSTLSSSTDTSPGSSPVRQSRSLHSTTKSIPLRPAKSLRPEEETSDRNGPYQNGQLKLDTLELERVPLSMPVLRLAFDFTTITTLALINCQGHDRLWKLLRNRYGPIGRRGSIAYQMSSNGCLNLKKIHTDTVSSHFLHFVRETLKPNTLETLFLQDRWGSRINVSSIFKHAIKRHRSSLKRLLINSGQLEEVFAEPNSRWRDWLLNRRMVAYLTSGKMSSLRELAVSIEYSDWHVFLQRLPRIPHLRSLYIPHIADHPHGSNVDTHDLALQVIDIIVLRPEIQLCYMGLGSKCFEILENRPLPTPPPARLSASSTANHRRSHIPHDDTSDSDATESLSDDDDTDPFDDSDSDVSTHAERDENEESSDSEDGIFFKRQKRKAAPNLRLQEILFYDKISIFKARHGRL